MARARAILLLLAALGGCALVHGSSKVANIRRVSLLFACHLDVGFHSGGPEPGFDNAVISRYFNEYFPAAAALGRQLRGRGGPERLAFLTHSWLVSLFLECPARIGITCPNATTVAHFKAAVRAGDIVWHATPHNAHVELYDEDLLRFGVRMTHDLDRAFGLPPKITMSHRDVPGLTRAAVPILADEGVKAISVGVNGGSAPPGVPKNRPFVWRDKDSGQQVLAMWHPGGYSGFPVDSRDECVQVHGLHHALCLAWSGDNSGPPSLQVVLDIHARVRAAFPHAAVAAAGFDAFVSDLLEAAPKLDLPVVTAEIGDTWIHGAASDPGKLSEYRALLRMRTASRERYDDDAFRRFSRLLLKLPEHTFGLDTKEYPGEWESWTNDELQQKLADKGSGNKFATAVSSWVRQRAYPLWAVQELGNSQAGLRAWEVLAALQGAKTPPVPHTDRSFRRCSLGEPLVFEAPFWRLELSNLTGAIISLRFKPSASSSSGSGGSSGGDARGGTCASASVSGISSRAPSLWARLLASLGLPSAGMLAARGGGRGGGSSPLDGSWASPDAQLALPIYSTYAEDDYEAIWSHYSYFPRDKLADWFYKDFGKPNSTVKGGARRADYLPQVREVWWRRTNDGGLTIAVKATLDEHAVEHAGAPRALWTEIRAPAGSPQLELDLTWQDKTPTRLPEALWLRWAPATAAANASSWRLHKLGRPVSPLDVLRNGSHGLHAVGDDGVSVGSADGARRLWIRSLDAAVVSPGRPSPFPRLSSPPDLRYGVSHCLTNNIWGTNFPMWVPYQSGDANMRFRFLLEVDHGGEGAGPQGGTAATATLAAA